MSRYGIVGYAFPGTTRKIGQLSDSLRNEMEFPDYSSRAVRTKTGITNLYY